jgi:hypothetical protein
MPLYNPGLLASKYTDSIIHYFNHSESANRCGFFLSHSLNHVCSGVFLRLFFFFFFSGGGAFMYSN